MARADEYLTPILTRRLIKKVAKVGNLSDACKAVRPKDWQDYRRAIRERMRHDGDLADAINEALDDYCDRLEAEADRRAVQGVKKFKVTGKGDFIRHPETGELLTETQYSDRLLIERLRALRPERYARKILTKIDFKAQITRLIAQAGFLVSDRDSQYLTDAQIKAWRGIKLAIADGRKGNPYDPIHGAIEGVAKEIEVKALEAIPDEDA